MEIALGVCGTAGRKDDAKKLSKNSFKSICIVIEELLKQLKKNNYSITHLISGGAAYADHSCVRLFLDKKVPHLRLFIPCQFEDGMFTDTHLLLRTALDTTNGERFAPGKTLNYYHNLFQRKTGINSLTEIQLAKNKGAEILLCRGGFRGRNYMIAKQSDFLVAVTFGNKNEVKEGGSADTLRRYLERVKKEGFFDKSFHYNLNDGKVYTGAIAPEKET